MALMAYQNLEPLGSYSTRPCESREGSPTGFALCTPHFLDNQMDDVGSLCGFVHPGAMVSRLILARSGIHPSKLDKSREHVEVCISPMCVLRSREPRDSILP